MIETSNIYYITLASYLLGLVFITCKTFVSSEKQIPWLLLIFWVTIGFPIVSNLGMQRNLDYNELISPTDDMESSWPVELLLTARISNLIIIWSFVAGLLRNIKTGLPRNGYSLLITFVFIPLSSVVSSYFGTSASGFGIALFRPIVVFATIYILVNENVAPLIRYIKIGCVIYAIGSLLVALLVPQYAILINDTNSILGSSRLYGIASHPNALGPIAALFLLLEVYSPNVSMYKWLTRLLVFVVFVWAQSKTAWFIFIVGLVIYGWFNAGSNIFALELRRRRLLLYPSIILLSLTLLLGIISSTSLTSNTTNNLVTLTGRTELWMITLGEWKKSPIFGYGPNLWDDEYRYKYFRADNTYAGQAHNMFIQSLGATGMLGFVFLIAFLVVLFSLAVRSMYWSSGLSLILAFFLLIRCITETPLRTTSLDESMFLNMSIFAVLILLNKTNMLQKQSI